MMQDYVRDQKPLHSNSMQFTWLNTWLFAWWRHRAIKSV